MTSNNKSRVLVTGGAGFIGHRLCKSLAAAGHAIHILDNLSVGMPMPENIPGITTRVVDIVDADATDREIAMFRPDAIVHLAAVHHIPTCEQKRAYSLSVNVIGTENVLAAAERHAVSRFVLASSGAVYDWVENELLEDGSPLRAADNYALAKLTNEQQLKFWTERTGAWSRVARIFNTIGHDDPNAHLIPDVLNQIPPGTKSANIELGNLAPRRDYIHADDTARAMAAILLDTRSDKTWDVFNVSGGAEASVRELVVAIGSSMGAEITVLEVETRRRRVDRVRQHASTRKLSETLGWSPQLNLTESIDDLVSKYWDVRRPR